MSEAALNLNNTFVDTKQNKYPNMSKPGTTNNPNGRPKGSRSKLGEAFLKDCMALWEEHGNQALRAMLADSPTKFCQMIQATLPKHIDIDTTDQVNWVINASPRLTEAEWRREHGLPGATKALESDT